MDQFSCQVNLFWDIVKTGRLIWALLLYDQPSYGQKLTTPISDLIAHENREMNRVSNNCYMRYKSCNCHHRSQCSDLGKDLINYTCNPNECEILNTLFHICLSICRSLLDYSVLDTLKWKVKCVHIEFENGYDLLIGDEIVAKQLKILIGNVDE